MVRPEGLQRGPVPEGELLPLLGEEGRGGCAVCMLPSVIQPEVWLQACGTGLSLFSSCWELSALQASPSVPSNCTE